MILRDEPYLSRNRAIVEASTLMLVVPGEATEQVRSGTWATWRYTKKVGVPSRLILPAVQPRVASGL